MSEEQVGWAPVGREEPMVRKQETRETSKNAKNARNVTKMSPLKEELLDSDLPARFETDVFVYTEIETTKTGTGRSSEKLMDDASEDAVTDRWNKVLGTGSLGTIDASGVF